jgi:hypothetical protein
LATLVYALASVASPGFKIDAGFGDYQPTKRHMLNSEENEPEARTFGHDPINALCMAVAFLALCGLVWIALTY